MALSDLERLISEGDDRPIKDDTLRAEIYAEIDWVRYHKRRKPGWTAQSYHKLFGVWPPGWMKGLTPQPPRDAIRRLVNRWDARYKRQRKKAEAEEKAQCDNSSS